MAAKRMPWLGLAAVMGITFMAGSAFAEDHAFNFADEVKKGEARAGFTLQVLVKEPTYTVGAVAVKDEIKAHRHKDGDHVLYIVTGQGTMTHGAQTIALKPGMVVHVPKGEVHSIKAQGGRAHLTGLCPTALQAGPDGVGSIAPPAARELLRTSKGLVT